MTDIEFRPWDQIPARRKRGRGDDREVLGETFLGEPVWLPWMGTPPWPQALASDLAFLASPLPSGGPRLVTGRYQRFRPEHGLPVRTTVGAPRFWRADQLGDLASLLDIAPYELMRGKASTAPVHEQRMIYRLRLERRALTVVVQLAGLAAAHPDRAVVLLCFEDVHAGEECHRRWFAEWFEAAYGIEVPELPAA